MGCWDRCQRIAEVRHPLWKVDVQPVGDMRGNGLEGDLAVLAPTELCHGGQCTRSPESSNTTSRG